MAKTSTPKNVANIANPALNLSAAFDASLSAKYVTAEQLITLPVKSAPLSKSTNPPPVVLSPPENTVYFAASSAAASVSLIQPVTALT